jgi:hypothetical protein
MAKMIQVRNVPDRLHRELKRRAKRRGQTLTAYVEDLLEREVATPPIDDVLDRIESLPRVDLGVSGADLVREAREEREREVASRAAERRKRAAS